MWVFKLESKLVLEYEVVGTEEPNVFKVESKLVLEYKVVGIEEFWVFKGCRYWRTNNI